MRSMRYVDYAFYRQRGEPRSPDAYTHKTKLSGFVGIGCGIEPKQVSPHRVIDVAFLNVSAGGVVVSLPVDGEVAGAIVDAVAAAAQFNSRPQ